MITKKLLAVTLPNCVHSVLVTLTLFSINNWVNYNTDFSVNDQETIGGNITKFCLNVKSSNIWFKSDYQTLETYISPTKKLLEVILPNFMYILLVTSLLALKLGNHTH